VKEAEEIAEAFLSCDAWEVRAVLESGFPFWGELWDPVGTISDFCPDRSL
jgi:hypothetical protein